MKRGRLLIFAVVALAILAAAAEGVTRLVFPGLPATARTMQFANPHRQQPESFIPDPILFWRLKPDNAAWQVNAAGFRGPWRPEAKPAGVYRVCCLGDSCTFGLGTPPLDYDRTYPALLEGLLAARLGRPVEVLNFGCPGYTSWQGRRLLETKVVKYAPDFVTAYFGINDGFEAIGFADADQKSVEPGAGWVGRMQGALWHSAFYSLLARGVTAARRASGCEGLVRVSPAEFQANAAAMRQLGEKLGFGVRFIPAMYIADDGTLAVEASSEVEPSVPLPAAFAATGLPADALFYPSPDRVHPTAQGHATIARVLADAVAAAAGH